MDELSAQAILNGLRTSWLGRNVLFYEKTGSTNSVAASLAQQGAQCSLRPRVLALVGSHRARDSRRGRSRWRAET